MISCPICGIYWDYVNEAPLHLRERYRIKEQGDCISHVAGEHSTLISIEMLSNEIQELITIVNERL